MRMMRVLYSYLKVTQIRYDEFSNSLGINNEFSYILMTFLMKRDCTVLGVSTNFTTTTS